MQVKNRGRKFLRTCGEPLHQPKKHGRNGRALRRLRAGILSVGSTPPNKRRPAPAGSRGPARCWRPANDAPAVLRLCPSISSPPSRRTPRRRPSGASSGRTNAGTSLLGWTPPRNPRLTSAGSNKPVRSSPLAGDAKLRNRSFQSFVTESTEDSQRVREPSGHLSSL